MTLPKHHDKKADDAKAARLARFVIAVATCLGALGMAALLYFPLRYLK